MSSVATLRNLLSVQGFVRLCAGNGLALSGLRLQSIAIAWLVLEITGSQLWLGIVVGAPALIVVCASLVGGVLADSPQAGRALRYTRFAMALAAGSAGVLVTTGEVEVELLMLVVLVTAFATAVDMPVGRTLIFEMVGQERLLSGTALNSMASNICATIGPLVVGALMSRVGVDAALYAIAAAYAVSGLLLPSIPRVATRRGISPLHELRAGLDYVRRTPCVAWLTSMFFLVPLAGVFFAMVPVFARDVLEAGPAGLGAIMAGWGAGTVLGSGYLVLNGKMRRRGLRVTLLGIVFGAGMFAFAVSTSIVVCGVISFGLGFVAMLWQNTLSAMLQTAAAPEMRGRAMSIGTMGVQLMSVGWLAAGVLSTFVGPVATVALAGTAFAGLSVFVFARSPDVRAID